MALGHWKPLLSGAHPQMSPSCQARDTEPENNVMWLLSQGVPEAKTDRVCSDNLAASSE